MASAGRILIIPKGAYSEETTYVPLDLVSHNGGSWLCKKESTGIEPSDENAEYWHAFTNNFYDNSKSGLEATNVQDAIDETVQRLGGLSFEVMSESAYQALAAKDANTLYIRPKE